MKSLSFLLPEVLPDNIIEDIKIMALRFPEEIGVVGGGIVRILNMKKILEDLKFVG